jgi:hypothetical protein
MAALSAKFVQFLYTIGRWHASGATIIRRRAGMAGLPSHAENCELGH